MFNSLQPWSCSREPGGETPSQRWAHSLSVLPPQIRVSPRLGEHRARSPRVSLGSLGKVYKGSRWGSSLPLLGGGARGSEWDSFTKAHRAPRRWAELGHGDPWEALLGWDTKYGGGVGLSVALGLTWVRWSLLAFPLAWTPPAHPHPNLSSSFSPLRSPCRCHLPNPL